MPTILKPELYDATLSVAKEIFATPGALDPFFLTKAEGSALYRYVSYRKGQPQEEEAARKIWTSLANDTGNRWTGLGTDKRGSQGLYMSGEFINEDSPFPELEHYQAPSGASTQEIEYIKYEAGSAPVKVRVSVSELRTLFLFTQTRALSGIDFSLQVNGDYHPLLTKILELVKRNNPVVLGVEDSLKSLYMSPNDASFTRAIGNALFELNTVEFFQATSVRDEMSPNIILKGTSDTPIDYLQPQGRTTFFVNSEGKRGLGFYTEDDLRYNDRFEQIGLG